jgi:hypothetical protein
MRAAVTPLACASVVPVPSPPSASQAGVRPCSQVNRALYGRKKMWSKTEPKTKWRFALVIDWPISFSEVKIFTFSLN